MRIVRFTPKSKTSLGTDPQYGILESEKTIRLIAGDPLYSGILKLDETVGPVSYTHLTLPTTSRV